MSKYCYLASVFDGERMHVVNLGRSRDAKENDLVRLSTGELGTVTSVEFTEIGGQEYNFIASLKPIEDDWIEMYRHGGRREEVDEST